jgi:hypothetical protein
MRMRKRAPKVKPTNLYIIPEGDEPEEQDFAEKAKAYARKRPQLSETELQVLNSGSLDHMIAYIQKLSSEQIKLFMQSEAPDFTQVAKDSFAARLEAIGLAGLDKVIVREEEKGAYFNRFIEQLKQVDLYTLQRKLDKGLENRQVDPRIRTQLEVQKYAASDGSDAGMVTRFMNEWPCLVEAEVFQAWLVDFNKLTDKCVLFNEDGAHYTPNSEGEPQDIDALSKKGVRKLVENCTQQALNDFCDEQGQIRPEIRQALQLDKLTPHLRQNKITEEFMLENLISNYLVNQVGSYLAEKAGAGMAEQLASDDEQIRKQAAFKIRKYGMLQKHFMDVLSQGFEANYTELLTPRVAIHRSLADLNSAIKKRKEQYGPEDPLYLASIETYNNARDISKQILNGSKVDKSDLASFSDVVRGTAAVVRDPVQGPTNKLYEAIKKAPTKKSSIWAKLGAGALFVLGMSAVVCGLAGTAFSGGLDLGASAYLGCKIAGVCFAAAGALWAGYQYKQTVALSSSLSKVVGAAKKVSQSEEESALNQPLQPRSLN